MKRRRSDLTFTLFPFLAVLMCTMGALVLLLLVTTRQLRERTLAQHEQATQASVIGEVPIEPTDPKLPPQLPANSVHPEDEAELMPLLAPEPPPGPSPAELARQAYARELAEREAARARLQQQWNQQLRELQQQRDRQQNAIRDGKRILASQQAKKDELQRQQAQLEQQRLALEQKLQQEAKRQQELTEEQQRAQQLLQQLQVKAVELKEQVIHQQPQLSIVTHDGRSGTRRRPILIECRADGLTFAAEQITLSSQDLTGFTPDYNPLKAGVEALIKYWIQHESSTSRDEKPYVLLVVRPEGTVAFYVAQMLLGKVDCENGYELILQDDQMAWPQPDPGAVEVCRAEVERVLADRQRLMSQVRGGRLPVSSELNFAGANGEFRMQEVDRMRNVRDPYAIANSDWIGPTRRKAEGSGNRTTGQRVYQPRPDHQSRNFAAGEAGSESRSGVFPSESFQSSQYSGGSSDQFGSGTAAEDSANRRIGEANRRPHPGMSTGDEGSLTDAGPWSSSATKTGGSRQPGTQSGTIIPPSPDAAQSGNSRREGVSEFDKAFGQNSDRAGGAMNEGSASRGSGKSGSGQAQSGLGQAGGGPNGVPAVTPGDAGAPGAGAQAVDRWAEDGGAQRQWGGPARSNAIGLERDVVLDLWGDAISLENSDQRLNIAPTSSRQELQQQVARLVEAQIHSWGPAPAAFVWRPTLLLRVHPGGNLHTGRIGELARHWGFRVRTEFILE